MNGFPHLVDDLVDDRPYTWRGNGKLIEVNERIMEARPPAKDPSADAPIPARRSRFGPQPRQRHQKAGEPLCEYCRVYARQEIAERRQRAREAS